MKSRWRVSNVLWLLPIGLSLLLIWLWRLFPKNPRNKKEMYKKILELINESEINELILLSADKKILLAKMLAAQSAHETGGFTSKSYTVAKNLFGMKESARMYEIGTYAGHARYKSVYDSILDMLDYLASRLKPLNDIAEMDVRQYAEYLKSVSYFEDSTINYANGLSAWYTKLFIGKEAIA